MKLNLLFLSIILSGGICFAQLPPAQPSIPIPGKVKETVTKRISPANPFQTEQTEICDNNLDDDGNMLVDCKDFHCYFSNATCKCKRSDIIWFGGASQLFWYDLQTGTKHLACIMEQGMNDITWAPDGKLYGLHNDILEINPNTGDTSFVRKLPDPYYTGNGMTADNKGNLYLNLYTPTRQWHLVKLNISTGNYSVIADLTSAGLESSGDVTFLNGSLYVSCSNLKIAKINVVTGAIQIKIIANPINSNLFGLVSLDGRDLYVGGGNQFYRLDTLTMQATEIDNFGSENWLIEGMSNYQDPCQSPSCLQPSVKIDTLSSAPYCASSGILLKASGNGILGPSGYEWTLSDGRKIISDTLRVRVNGTYKVRYYSITESCGEETVVNINLIQNPVSNLGKDTLICPGESIVLKPINNSGVSSYLWQDGSTLSQLSVSAPGLYWLQTSNVCGVARDSILVSPLQKPTVNLGVDKELCSGYNLVLKNLIHQDGLQYMWQNTFSGDSFIVRRPGVYWVNAHNSCGTAEDTIVVREKTIDCICQLFVPTSFTPNNDGLNDNIKALSNCAINGELFIYNRWGELIYYSKDLQRGWNGIYNGKPQPPGVYIYQVNYSYPSTPTPGKYSKKGTVVLMR
jgi:gliding motility-associated-like protein